MATNSNNVQVEQVNTDIITLTRFLTEEQAKHAEATGDFTWVDPPPSNPPGKLLIDLLDCSAMPSNSPSSR